MKKPRRNLDREGLEVYLLNLLLAYRPLLQISGWLLLAYALLALSASLLASAIALGLATLLLITANWYPALLAAAKFGAWLGTIGRK